MRTAGRWDVPEIVWYVTAVCMFVVVVVLLVLILSRRIRQDLGLSPKPATAKPNERRHARFRKPDPPSRSNGIYDGPTTPLKTPRGIATVI